MNFLRTQWAEPCEGFDRSFTYNWKWTSILRTPRLIQGESSSHGDWWSVSDGQWWRCLVTLIDGWWFINYGWLIVTSEGWWSLLLNGHEWWFTVVHLWLTMVHLNSFDCSSAKGSAILIHHLAFFAMASILTGCCYWVHVVAQHSWGLFKVKYQLHGRWTICKYICIYKWVREELVAIANFLNAVSDVWILFELATK